MADIDFLKLKLCATLALCGIWEKYESVRAPEVAFVQFLLTSCSSCQNVIDGALRCGDRQASLDRE